jgi:hypothetical protein
VLHLSIHNGKLASAAANMECFRSYSSNGIGIGIFSSLALIAEMGSNLLTVCLFLLLAMGWMISMQKMPQVSGILAV